MVDLRCTVGVSNFLVEGVSGAGKTTVCDELGRRGYQAIHGDRVLAYQGDPGTGAPKDEGLGHEHHIWDVTSVRVIVADRAELLTFFCGGSRNVDTFVHLFDGVFVLEVDVDTLHRRLDARPDSDWGGGEPVERALVVRLHETKEDLPRHGITVDATAPIAAVVDEILRRARQLAGLDREGR